MIDVDIKKCGACQYYMHRTNRCGRKNDTPITNSSTIACNDFRLDAEWRLAVRRAQRRSRLRMNGTFSLKIVPQLNNLIASAADQLNMSRTQMVRHIFDKYDTGWLYDEEIVDESICKSGTVNVNFRAAYNIPDLPAQEIRMMIATFCSSQYRIDQLKSHLKELE